MALDYEKYEEDCAQIRKENALLLDEFAASLAANGLSETTVERHCENIEFYLDSYLQYEGAQRAEEGVHQVPMFLGYWFIRKASWASPATIKSNAASLKKFYAFMLAKGKVTQADFADLTMTIKQEMPNWLATLDRYDDPDIVDPAQIWGL